MTPRRHRRQRGAALLTAMVIVTLVTTLAAAMVWQQWRAVRVEAAERGRLQAAWILAGALDYARHILREDARAAGPPADHLKEPWATPMRDTPLSAFLAADKNNTDDAPEVFLSGQISDAQSRYNLRNLFNDDAGKLIPAELESLKRLCTTAGVSADVAERLANALVAAYAGNEAAALMPQSVAQLEWLGIEPDTVRRLATLVVLLPVPTPLNLNTASSEVIAAALPGLSPGDAARLVDGRPRDGFKTLDDARKLLPESITLTNRQAGVSSRYFEVRSQLRMEDRVMQERSLLERRNPDVAPIQRERVNMNDPGG